MNVKMIIILVALTAVTMADGKLIDYRLKPDGRI